MSEFSVGQWQGFYKFGREYGEMIEGKEAQFRMFVETFQNGQFSGRTIDWEGYGAEGHTAIIKGFVDGDLISFTKKYEHYLYFDEWGNTLVDEQQRGLTVVYEGRFDEGSKQYAGTWEISVELEHTPDATWADVMTVTWWMHLQ